MDEKEKLEWLERFVANPESVTIEDYNENTHSLTHEEVVEQNNARLEEYLKIYYESMDGDSKKKR